MEERTQTDDGPHGILVDAVRSPVTGALCLVAIVFSIAAWAGPGFDPFVTDDRAFRGEPWRLLSSHLVHADGLHFAANLYWTWIFGRFLEPRLGALRLALVVLALAVGVDLACHAFDEGGIGLSGIGYGLWALILVGGRHITAWRGGLPRSVHVMFVIWFFLCIAMTLGGAWNVSNVGHASGALLGAALGLALDAQTRFRSRAVAAFAAGL